MTYYFNKLENEFLSRGVLHTSMLLLDRNSSIDFIKKIDPLGGKLLGFDGFFLNSNSIQPSMEHSRDYSDSDIDGINDALNFLANKQLDGMFFEIVTSGIE